MDTSKIREAFLNAPEKQEDVDIPEWLAPLLEPDTQLAIKDMASDLLSTLRKQYLKDQNDAAFAASIICNCLINKADGQLIFQTTDRDFIAKLGYTKLEPLYIQAGRFFGFSTTPVADAKKN